MRAQAVLDRVGLQRPDSDRQETREWLESLDALIDMWGPNRARFLLVKLAERARDRGADVPVAVSTPYVNTIPFVAGASLSW